MKHVRSLFRATTVAALLCIATSATGEIHRGGKFAPLNRVRQPTAMERYIAKADAALQAAQQSDKENASAAIATLSALIDDPLFSMLPKPGQRMLVSAKATATWRRGELEGARDLYLQATRIDGNEPDDWYRLARLERYLGNRARSARYLTALVQRWPDLVNNLDRELVAEPVYQGEAGASWRTALMQALFDADWNDRGNGVDGIWQKLALARLDEGNPTAAANVIGRIRDPLVIISMRSDKRFDAIATSVDALPTAREAAERRVEALRRVVAESPKRLDLASQLSTDLLVAGHHDEALAVADATLAAVAADPTAFESLDKKVWVMNDRAIALRRLGRVDEAVAEIERASRVDEVDAPNVSQVLNLATFYCHLGRPKEALSTVERVGNMSGYGRMVLSAVRHCAAIQSGDRRAAAEELDYMLAHRKDSETIVLEALLREGRVDDAAKALIGRLEDPRTREDSLSFVQEFRTGPELVGRRSYSAHRRALLARDDVRAAVAKVGRMGVHDVFDITGIE